MEIALVYFAVLALGVLPPDRAPAAASGRGRTGSSSPTLSRRRRGRDHRRDLRHRSAASTTTRSSSRSRPGIVITRRPAGDRPAGRSRPRADADRRHRRRRRHPTIDAAVRRRPGAESCGGTSSSWSSSVVHRLGTFLATLASGNTPVLGLDLQGGVSVVLSPVGQVQARRRSTSPSTSSATGSTASASLEPEISRQGNDIVVDLPGVKDRAQGRAPRRARPPSCASARCSPHAAAGGAEDAAPRPPPRRRRGTTTTTAPRPRRRPPPRPPRRVDRRSAEARDAAIASCDADRGRRAHRRSRPRRVTDDKRNACVVLPDKPGGEGAPRYYLGPAGLTGQGTSSSAKAEFRPGQGWTVKMDLTDAGQRASGTPLAQAAVPQAGRDRARQHRAVGARDPARRPSFTSFGGTAVISGNFTQGRGRRPRQADQLRRAAGAAQADQRARTCRRRSARTSSTPGIVAGIIGLALVALYMLVFYRLLGLVVIAGLVLSGDGALLADRVDPPGAVRHQHRAHARRGHRHHRVGRYHRRLVHRLLRTIERRGARGRHRARLRRPRRSPARSARSSPPTSCR